MADEKTPSQAHTRREKKRRSPLSMFSAMTVSAVAASLATGGAPANADDYPSWNDVQQAKKNESTKKAEIDKIVELVGGLRATAEQANRDSLIAAEAYRVTNEALGKASGRVESLSRKAQAAAQKADVSRMRAGLMVAHLAKSGGGELSVNLLANNGDADDLLYQLGTAAKLTEQSSAIYATAVTEKNTATALGQEAAAAQKEYEELALQAEQQLESARFAATAARSLLDVQRQKSEELVAQLASLKDSTIDAERAYLAGLEAERQPQSPGGSDDWNGDDEPSDDNDDPPRYDDGPAPEPEPDPVAPPDGGIVENAVGFALDQVGDPYVLGASGPDAWDCSGLTMKAYSSAGIHIGNHSATHQYVSMSNKGKLVPFSERQRGDLIFWSSGYDMYHVAIYLGNGRIVEAANEDAGTRVGGIWGMGDVAGYVGRPTG